MGFDTTLRSVTACVAAMLARLMQEVDGCRWHVGTRVAEEMEHPSPCCYQIRVAGEGGVAVPCHHGCFSA